VEHRVYVEQLNSNESTVENDKFKKYRKSQIAEMCPWDESTDMTRVSVSASDREDGSPKVGDMIARNPKNHEDQWLVAADFFAANYVPAEE